MTCCKKNPALEITADELRHRVMFQTSTPTADGIGGRTLSWSNTTAAWASIKPYRGLEVFRSLQTETPISHKVRMRYLPGITTKHRLRFGTRIFDIKSVINVEERNQVLELLCTEGETDD